jgi:hypothetical protein
MKGLGQGSAETIGNRKKDKAPPLIAVEVAVLGPVG